MKYVRLLLIFIIIDQAFSEEGHKYIHIGNDSIKFSYEFKLLPEYSKVFKDGLDIFLIPLKKFIEEYEGEISELFLKIDADKNNNLIVGLNILYDFELDDIVRNVYKLNRNNELILYSILYAKLFRVLACYINYICCANYMTIYVDDLYRYWLENYLVKYEIDNIQLNYKLAKIMANKNVSYILYMYRNSDEFIAFSANGKLSTIHNYVKIDKTIAIKTKKYGTDFFNDIEYYPIKGYFKTLKTLSLVDLSNHNKHLYEYYGLEY